MVEYADRRVWDIQGHEVTYLHIDYRFAFDCWWQPDNELSVTIETPFTLSHRGQTVTCDPNDLNSLKDAITILHKPVATLEAHRDGQFLVTFCDGTQLHVPKDPKYESWEAHGKGELQDLSLLCSPHEGPPWGD